METVVASPSGAAASLAALEQRVAYDLACLDYPTRPWIPAARTADGAVILDALIVGAGQSGLAAAWALRRKRIDTVRIVDAAPAGQEGPWVTYARMDTLRTPKYVTAMDGGCPSLGFRAWYDANGLQPPWAGLERAPRQVWMAYLNWFRRVLAIPVENQLAMEHVVPAQDANIPDLLHVTLRHADGRRETVTTRKLVLATGLDGGGRMSGPFELAANLPSTAWAHAYHDIDFTALRGKRVAVLGMGSAAADNASTALQAGCLRADLFARKRYIAELEARDWVEHTGFLEAFADLDDDLRWHSSHRRIGVSSPAPTWSMDKCRAYDNCHFHYGCAWQALAWRDGEIVITTATGEHHTDFIIFATGANVDFTSRPELAAHAAHIKLWRHAYQPRADEHCEATLGYPYLNAGFALQPRENGRATYLANIHLFNHAAAASMGVGAASVTGLGFASDRLAHALVQDLYRAVADEHMARNPWQKLGAGYD